ncbi:probable indole-3-pyruvate monooxygenase YUCCA10 [Olea europaea var. sylvestris]|uniref:Flavin-containing monooxygenase n=1 Tax=Olea europaea subsp. europaea TaxID=158383 RepID=A0A8S0T0A0_OLEEU|nr:probable indole-3-pyruvate monooxygenase YUCCA10 [Olea europaea var. sylvestris]CAA2998310.1 probable indole-3-pyruvate monooxygenase YUCCA10 [Olea europaea subsp. europaea]
MAEVQEKVIIVGAGPSGLATAACLSQFSVPYMILEREDCFASLWKKYSYDRLHLHLAKQFCELPHFKLPSSCPTYVSKNDFIHYLDEYVSHFKINPAYGKSVKSAVYDEPTKKWKIQAQNVSSNKVEEFSCRFLVVATGETCDAFVPEFEGLNTFAGEKIHSTQYKNGEKFREKSVLVIGSGNSGMEIALDLANYGAKTSIAVRSPIHILSREMAYMGLFLLNYVPFNFVDNLLTFLSKLIYGDLTKHGIKRPQEGPFALKVKYGKYPVIDVGTYQKIKNGVIQVLPGITNIKGNDVVFENGKEHPFDAIIFATGFNRSTNQWLKGDDYLLNEDGLPKPSFPNHWKGKNGLYCSGLSRRGFHGAALDAQNIANDIKALL